MLGSINTGGFSKSQVDAMRDSNYFNRTGVEGVYDPIDKKAPIIFDKKMDNDLKFNNIVDTDLYEKNVGNILDLEIEEEYDEIFFNVNDLCNPLINNP